MALKKLGHALAVEVLSLDAKRQRLEAAHQQISIVRVEHPAQHPQLLAEQSNQLLVPGHHPGQQIVVAAKILGSRVQNQVNPKLQRPQIERRRKRRIHQRLHIVALRNLGHPPQVQHAQIRVRGRFGDDEPGRRTNGGFQGHVVTHRHDGAIHPELLEEVQAELARAAIRVVGDHDMSAGLQQRQQSRSHRRHAGRIQHCRFRALKRGQLGLGGGYGGVAIAAILGAAFGRAPHSRIHKIAQVGGVLERVGRRLHHRRRERVVGVGPRGPGVHGGGGSA